MKAWVIYDTRGYADTDEAAVMSAMSGEDSTVEDAIKERDESWPGCPVYEYDLVLDKEAYGGNKSINERLVS